MKEKCMQNKKRKLIIAVDFDGTITEGNYWPECLQVQKGAKEAINFWHDELNCEIIIWTCRDNKLHNDLDRAIEFLKNNDIHYDFINENGSILEDWPNDPRKIYADFYIDDKSFIFEPINWSKLEDFIAEFKYRYEDCFI